MSPWLRLQGVLADVSIATGYVTIALMVGGRLVFQHLGWAVAAFITPAVLMLFGGAFFGFSLSGSASTASWAVFAGAITQVCMPSRHTYDSHTCLKYLLCTLCRLHHEWRMW